MARVHVGRRRELAELGEALAAARMGCGAAVVVSGSAGMGKTWLLDGVASLAEAHGVSVVRGSAVLNEGMPDFWVWRRVLSEGRELGLDPGVLDVMSWAPSQAEFLVDVAVGAQLTRAADPHGLVVLLDDLHWADSPSVRLLAHFARELARSHVLVVAATRDTSRLAAMADRADVRWLSVKGWDLADVDAYLRAVVDGPFDQSWVTTLHEIAAGNPLYVRELVHNVRRTASFATQPTDVALPESLRMALRQRLSTLSGACRVVVDAACVVGDEAAMSVLRAVAGREPDELTATLTEAVDAGVLHWTATRSLRFDHPLLRRATYDSISEPRRIALHLAVAEALADGQPLADSAGPVTWHLVRAAVDQAGAERAIHACRRSALTAMASGRTSEAAAWCRRAIELASLARLSPGELAELFLRSAEAAFGLLAVDEALRHSESCADLADGAARPDLMASAALVVRGVGGAAVNRRVAALCRRAQARIGDDKAMAARLWAQHAMALIEQTDEVPDDAERAVAVELLRRATEVTLDHEDRTASVDIYHARERLASGPDSAASRIGLGIRLAALGTVKERPESTVWAYLWQIDGLLQVGEVAKADAAIAGLALVAEQLAWPMAHWQLLRVRAARAMLSGDFAGAESLALGGKELGQRYGDPSMMGQYYAYRLEMQRQLGAFDADDRAAVAAMAEADPRPLVLAVAAEYLLAAGEDERARIVYARLVPTVGTLPANRQQPAIWAMAGELAVSLFDLTTAATCRRLLSPYESKYNASSNGYRGCFARPLAMMTAYLDGLASAERLFALAMQQERRVGAAAGLILAQLAYAQAIQRSSRGDDGTVRRLAGAVIRGASRLQMAPAVAAASELLAKLDSAKDAVASKLTARENEITTLLADGMTNHAIASRLFISERTVESHVSNITAKLGLVNRTQVAAWALRNT